MYGRLPKGVPPAAVTNLGPLASGTLKKNEETRQVLQLNPHELGKVVIEGMACQLPSR